MSAICQAEMLCSGDQEPMLLGVKVVGTVNGRLLAMCLQQRFRNASDTNTEITYTFPLPFGAVLMGVDVELNGLPLSGEVAAMSTARARYEEALSGGDSGILVGRNPDHTYTLELGNLLAGEECLISVRYAQMLQMAHGQIRLMLPTTIAPRYGNPITQGSLQPHQMPVSDITAEYPFDISITLHGELSKANVTSPSHKLSYVPLSDALELKLAQSSALDRDFVLTLSQLQNASVAIACPDISVPGQSALMASFSPHLIDGQPRQVSAKILVDCSGSMAGDSMGAARNALKRILSDLDAADHFSLTRFGDTVEHRSRGMWSGTAQAKASARRWIDTLDANLGGTEMEDALVSTIALAHSGQSDILLITDGEIYGIDEVIGVAKKSGHRIFAVAIGASPAETHLRRLALATGGACDFVAPGEDVEPAVLRMFSRMRSSRVSKLRVEWFKGMNIRWAQTVPDFVFEDDALTTCAFADTPDAQSGQQTVGLWGCLEGSESEVLLAQVEVVPADSGINTQARMAAVAQVAELEQDRDGQFNTGSPQGLALAVQYQLLTEETHFILVHARKVDEKAKEMPSAHQVPNMLAAGWGGTGSISYSVAEQTADSNRMVRSGGSKITFNMASTTAASTLDDNKALPSVWRTSRTSASANAAASGGLDDYEIPAFLRTQTDGPQYRYRSTPDDAGINPGELAEWLDSHPHAKWPITYDALRHLGLSLPMCEWLEFEIGSDKVESDVVRAFIAVIQSLNFVSASGLRHLLGRYRRQAQAGNGTKFDEQIARDIRIGLNGIGAAMWPQTVTSFPQCSSL